MNKRLIITEQELTTLRLLAKDVCSDKNKHPHFAGVYVKPLDISNIPATVRPIIVDVFGEKITEFSVVSLGYDGIPSHSHNEGEIYFCPDSTCDILDHPYKITLAQEEYHMILPNTLHGVVHGKPSRVTMFSVKFI